MARDLEEILSELREWAKENKERCVFCVIQREDNFCKGAINGSLINLATCLAAFSTKDSPVKRVLCAAEALNQLSGEEVEADSEDE